MAKNTNGDWKFEARHPERDAGCGGGKLFNCGHVISSRWSLWMGIPVSLLAVGMYLGLAIALFFGASATYSNRVRHAGWALVSVFAMAAGMAAIWFISLQVLVLNHLCTYCLAAHACGLVAAGAVLWTRPNGWGGLKPAAAISWMISSQLTPNHAAAKAQAVTLDDREKLAADLASQIPVQTPDHKKLGEIQEVVIDVETGRVAYAVLCFGGFFGFGDKFFAVPWAEFSLVHDETEMFFVVDTTREKLKRLQGFDIEDWPNVASSDWDKLIQLDDRYSEAGENELDDGDYEEVEKRDMNC